MLEFLRRHHKTLWIVVTAIVIIAFTVFGSITKTGSRAGHSVDDTAFEIYGHEYSFSDVKRTARGYRLAAGLMLQGSENYYASEMATIVSGFRNQKDNTPFVLGERGDGPLDYVINLLVLREELEKNGIHASDAEVKDKFHELPMFQTEGQFDASKAEAFESNLGSFGMRVDDVYELLRDWIGYLKLRQLVAGNMAPTSDMTGQFYAAQMQTIKVASIPFALDKFKKDAQVSEDRIQKYYAQKKDAFKTPEQRAVSYVFFESPKDLEKASDEERKRKNAEFGEKVQRFLSESYAAGVDFDELAKKSMVEVKKVPAFSLADMPEDLKKNMMLVYEIFHNDPKTHPVSDAVKAENGYYFFKVTEIKAPQQQQLKDVEGKIKEMLANQDAEEAMMKAANDARKKLADDIKAGKKFEDAAKEAGLEPQMLPEFSVAEPLKEISNGKEIALKAMKSPAGSFTEPLSTDNGVLLVYVLAKELRKNPDSIKKREEITQSLGDYTQSQVFRAWFGKRRDEAEVKTHFKI